MYDNDDDDDDAEKDDDSDLDGEDTVGYDDGTTESARQERQ